MQLQTCRELSSDSAVCCISFESFSLFWIFVLIFLGSFLAAIGECFQKKNFDTLYALPSKHQTAHSWLIIISVCQYNSQALLWIVVSKMCENWKKLTLFGCRFIFSPQLQIPLKGFCTCTIKHYFLFCCFLGSLILEAVSNL